MSNEVKVKGETMTNEQFQKLKEDLSNDKSQKLKEVGPNEYTVLKKMNG